jgi:hypothetical protein
MQSKSEKDFECFGQHWSERARDNVSRIRVVVDPEFEKAKPTPAPISASGGIVHGPY